MSLLETVPLSCPYCGEPIHIVVDCSVGDHSYIEDCEVCCRPILFDISLDDSGLPSVRASRDDD